MCLIHLIYWHTLLTEIKAVKTREFDPLWGHGAAMLFCQHSQAFIRNTQVDTVALAGFVQWAGTNGIFI